MSEKKSYRITNISSIVMPPHGLALDFNGTIIAKNRSAVIVADALDPIIEEWVEKRWAKVQNAASGELVMKSSSDSAALAGPHLNEASALRLSKNATAVRQNQAQPDLALIDDEAEEFEADFNPAVAQEATLENTRPIAGDLRQQSGTQPRARVSLGSENEDQGGHDLSPIPGDRPRSVDDSGKFTIRAPRQNGVGGVVK